MITRELLIKLGFDIDESKLNKFSSVVDNAKNKMADLRENVAKKIGASDIKFAQIKAYRDELLSFSKEERNEILLNNKLEKAAINEVKREERQKHLEKQRQLREEQRLESKYHFASWRAGMINASRKIAIAGATIMGSLLVGGDARNDLTKKYDFEPAFSFVQHVAIDQHVLARNRQFDLIPVIEYYPTNIGVAIDESTAIIVDAQQFKVIGASYALLFDPKDWEQQKKEWGRVIKPFKMMAAGDCFNWNTRKITP